MKVLWLIECGEPASYYCGIGDWCSNPNHARKYRTRAEAEWVLKAIDQEMVGGPARVIEHMWVE